MLRKQIQLGLIHVAVAMTLVPINSTLNRVMIKELALSATIVSILATLPYLFSPIQVAIGSFSDRNPIFGLRRTPYILLGLLLTVIGVIISPQVAFLMTENWWAGVGVGVLAFGAWGMGYNFASVAYLSLASEISGEKARGRTIAVMWFMMITSIILTSIALSQMVDPYSPQALMRAFTVIGLAALGLGLVGIVALEVPQRKAHALHSAGGHSWGQMFQTVLANRQATRFFWYLVILLAAILGQDILLEPFGGEAFSLSVKQTTRITSLWGVNVLVALLIAGVLRSAHWETHGRSTRRLGSPGRFPADFCQWFAAKPGDFLGRRGFIGNWHRAFYGFEFVFNAGYDHGQQCWPVHRCLGYGKCIVTPGGHDSGWRCARPGYANFSVANWGLRRCFRD